VLGIGTPAIWWASIPALVWMCWLLISRVDWRALAILVGFAAGYLPWFLTPERTMFLFYALPSVPFMVLALTFCAGQVLGRASPHSRRSVVGAVLVGGYLCLTTLNFFYFYPVLAGQNITYAQWQDRMWFQNCSGHSQHHESAPCWI
jgi:dolichyl-phosphate-mannose--protein O-mannosyl transferase